MAETIFPDMDPFPDTGRLTARDGLSGNLLWRYKPFNTNKYTKGFRFRPVTRDETGFMLSFSDDISDTLKTIFFDLGAVLVHVNLCQFYKRMALLTQTSPDEVMLLVGEFKSLSHQFELGNLEPQSFYQTIVDRFERQSFSYEDFVSAYTDLFSLNHPLWSVAQQLKESYTVSIISNTDALHYHRICKDYPIEQVFSQPVTSYSVHQRKPGPDIYQTALDRFDIEPSQALFIDDRWENVEGAIRLGITGLQYVTTEKLVHDLYRVGLECKSR